MPYVSDEVLDNLQAQLEELKAGLKDNAAFEARSHRLLENLHNAAIAAIDLISEGDAEQAKSVLLDADEAYESYETTIRAELMVKFAANARKMRDALRGKDA